MNPSKRACKDVKASHRDSLYVVRPGISGLACTRKADMRFSGSKLAGNEGVLTFYQRIKQWLLILRKEAFVKVICMSQKWILAAKRHSGTCSLACRVARTSSERAKCPSPENFTCHTSRAVNCTRCEERGTRHMMVLERNSTL